MYKMDETIEAKFQKLSEQYLNMLRNKIKFKQMLVDLKNLQLIDPELRAKLLFIHEFNPTYKFSEANLDANFNLCKELERKYKCLKSEDRLTRTKMFSDRLNIDARYENEVVPIADFVLIRKTDLPDAEVTLKSGMVTNLVKGIEEIMGNKPVLVKPKKYVADDTALLTLQPPVEEKVIISKTAKYDLTCDTTNFSFTGSKIFNGNSNSNAGMLQDLIIEKRKSNKPITVILSGNSHSGKRETFLHIITNMSAIISTDDLLKCSLTEWIPSVKNTINKGLVVEECDNCVRDLLSADKSPNFTRMPYDLKIINEKLSDRAKLQYFHRNKRPHGYKPHTFLTSVIFLTIYLHDTPVLSVIDLPETDQITGDLSEDSECRTNKNAARGINFVYEIFEFLIKNKQERGILMCKPEVLIMDGQISSPIESVLFGDTGEKGQALSKSVSKMKHNKKGELQKYEVQIDLARPSLYAAISVTKDANLKREISNLYGKDFSEILKIYEASEAIARNGLESVNKLQLLNAEEIKTDVKEGRSEAVTKLKEENLRAVSAELSKLQIQAISLNTTSALRINRGLCEVSLPTTRNLEGFPEIENFKDRNVVASEIDKFLYKYNKSSLFDIFQKMFFSQDAILGILNQVESKLIVAFNVLGNRSKTSLLNNDTIKSPEQNQMLPEDAKFYKDQTILNLKYITKFKARFTECTPTLGGSRRTRKLLRTQN